MFKAFYIFFTIRKGISFVKPFSAHTAANKSTLTVFAFSTSEYDCQYLKTYSFDLHAFRIQLHHLLFKCIHTNEF